MRRWVVLVALLGMGANKTPAESFKETTKQLLREDVCEKAQAEAERTEQQCGKDVEDCAEPCNKCKAPCDTAKAFDVDACEIEPLPKQCTQAAQERHSECTKACNAGGACSRDTPACKAKNESCKAARDAAKAAMEACKK